MDAQSLTIVGAIAGIAIARWLLGRDARAYAERRARREAGEPEAAPGPVVGQHWTTPARIGRGSGWPLWAYVVAGVVLLVAYGAVGWLGRVLGV